MLNPSSDGKFMLGLQNPSSPATIKLYNIRYNT
jgi:hypothetical protein